MRSLAVGLAAAVLATPVAAGAPSGAESARLAILDRSPLLVRGVRFKEHELVTVRVIVRGGRTVAKTVRAGAAGRWTARFAAVSLGHCAFLLVRATGAKGSRAVYTEHPPPCGPAP